MAITRYPRLASDRLAVQRDRDAALSRVGRVRRLTIFGAGALTAGLAAAVSAIAPGRSLGAKATVVREPSSARAARRPAGSGTLRMPGLASPGALGLRAPQSAPQASAAGSTSQSAPSAPASPAAPAQAAPAQAAPAQTAAPTQAAPAPAAPAQNAAPAPAPSGGGGVVSGGS
jgi:hypothetical protein